MRFPAGTRAARPKHRAAAAAFACCLLPGAFASGGQVPGETAERGPYRVGDITAAPGAAVSGRLEVPPAGGDEGTFIPLTVVHGIRPGPVLTLVAGIHGSEYSPILAMQRLRPLLDPAELDGTVVLVHMANLPAFLGRTIYYTPGDWKNLNGAFPGKADGTLTERLAYTLHEEVIARADYMMDIHSGDANEWLRPSWTGYYGKAGTPEVIAASRRMAIAFGIDTIVEFQWEFEDTGARWGGSAAVALGIPSMDVEAGEMGLIEDRRIDPIVEGVLSVMRDLGMVEGEPSPAENPIIIRDRAFLSSEHDGVWDPDTRVRAGQFVAEGARLGVVRDFYGNPLQELRAPVAGLMLILLGTPPVNEGETIAVIAHVE